MKTPVEILKEHWGYPGFRNHQPEIIEEVLRGKDVVGLLPTGGGKSICYQVPALILEGICIVISPLLALMKDQVEQLKRRGISASLINSTMRSSEIDATLDNCIYGKVKFLYISPERISSNLFQQRLMRMKISMIAVDEAHCISDWGHDFRPAYRQIARMREWIPQAPIMALTASATPLVLEDIIGQLELKKPKIIRGTFLRSNLRYLCVKNEDKLGRLLHLIAKKPGTGIVYATTRRKCKFIADMLSSRGVPALPYHAGMSYEERTSAQEKWMNNSCRVIVATNAFGMGIDKPDVRFVAHWDIPASPEAYYQEAGRAGRDGDKSYAVLFYHDADLKDLERKIKTSFPEIATIRQVYQALADFFQLAIGSGQGEFFEIDLGKFAKRYQFSPVQALNAIKILEDNEYIYLSDAIHNPSRLKFAVSNETLYNFEMNNPRFSDIIQILLRNYTGLFDELCIIHENELAGKIKKNHAFVVDQLNRLKNQRIVEYFPASDKPVITYNAARVDAVKMRLNKDLIQAKKDRALKKLDAILQYTTDSENCRSLLLGAYFGENSSIPCGVCDNCVAKKRLLRQEKDLEKYMEVVKNLVAVKDLFIKDLVAQLSINEKFILMVVRLLAEEDILVIHPNQKLSINEKQLTIKAE